MSLRVTRSQAGKTPVKPSRPDFVETPGRRKSRRKSVVPDGDAAYESTPEPGVGLHGSESKTTAASDGDANGHPNGYTNGDANGHANGHANGDSNGHMSKTEAIAYDWKVEAEKNFPPTEEKGKHEFGGALGMSAMMICFPALMYYMWIGAIFYDGKFPARADGQSWGQFFGHMWYLVKTEAYPNNRAWQIYWFFGLVQMAFYMLMPGVYRKGKALPHLGGKQLDYYCSAMWSFYSSIVIALVLHFTGVFKIYTLVDEFGHIMSVAIISGFLCSFIAYFSALVRGETVRMTNSPIVDFFLGAELNPRLFGILDFKMFLEVRIPWFILFFMSLGTCLKQYEVYGKPSMEAVFLLFAHYLYAGACSKGEHLIITSWDMYYEKLGFMLIFWNMAGVPLSYCHCILFVATHDPADYTWPSWFIAFLTVAYLGFYYIWDTTNSQKNQFRQEERGVVEERTTFPYFKYGRIANPKTITTKSGSKILADGWYGKARKIHYTCDFFFAISWGLITGFKSPFPWFYSVFFGCMIVHRAIRDIQRCRDNYGEAWAEYERQVPYLFIPYVF
ncbi:ergosterol biosynthesis ERG4/ERG24 family-domain-containing protein [Ampelomyces quisqualis]|uniref:Delta(24(24(1)))-sterol reductase n=1 Tax=Ampelomyces quisqualis TaxID=50730 RepID=A0A6A5QF40_AMPQU|nr:ergosterol biosynthesis ERG4/ERG24 family-domain-containing protein [Ampelomyces quisqualis]